MILLFSGGIDSFVAWHFLNKPRTVYFDVRSRYSEKEKAVVLGLIPSTIVDSSLNLGDREVGEKAYIPFRNLLLACQAVKYSDTIVIAGLKDDQVSDKNEQMFFRFSDLMSDLEGRHIRVISPFWQMTKAQVVRWFLQNNGTPESLLRTISCYSPEPGVTYCGKCPSCFRKWCALIDNGIELPFHNKELQEAYRRAALAGKYDPERNASILRSLERGKQCESA